MQTMMRRTGRRTIGLIFIPLLGLSLAACGGGPTLPSIPPTTGGSTPTTPASTASTGSSANPAGSTTPSSADTSAIRAVIQRANDAQVQAVAAQDPAPMKDTATAAYYTQSAQDLQALLDAGISTIKLVNLQWGSITLQGASTAQATTTETWQTTAADGSTSQNTDANVYILVREGGTWKIQDDQHPRAQQQPFPQRPSRQQPTPQPSQPAQQPGRQQPTTTPGSSSAPVSSRMAGTLAVAVSSADPQAQAIVDNARARLDQVNAVHYRLTIDGDLAIDAAKTLKLKSAEGDLLRPDKAAATAKVAIGPVNATVRFMQIGNDTYMTNLLTGKWEKAPGGLGFDPSVVLDPQNGVASMLSKISGWQYIESTQVDGVDTQHLRGSVPVEAVNAFLAGSMRGDAVDVDLYVEGQNNDIVRFVIAEQTAAVTPGTGASRWTLDLSNQNGNISILPPI